jgi:hypothetical protein
MNSRFKKQIGRIAHVLAPASLAGVALLGRAYAGGVVLQVMPELTQIQLILAQIGPALSAVLFIVAGVFYAIGQMLPPDKKAQFHTTAVNIIIGAIVVGALSVASTSLATASTHILSNLTVSNTLNQTTNGIG